ncbi:MAG: DUF4143 domain-containing protein, partial [Synergistaceae bacterium]|nr:DUF4143 domain-containing protein [Synergistaceae bacterium]
EGLLLDLPAIAIDGLKGIGKTDSSKSIARSVFELDREQDRLMVFNDMSSLSKATPPVLVDEWQKIPAVWDFIRREVDEQKKAGYYLLTGSVSAKNLDVHSGAGRIVRMRMYPLSLQERGLDKASVSIDSLFSQKRPFSEPVSGETNVSFEEYLNEIALSGLPGLRIGQEKNRRLMIGSYLDNLLTHDFAQEGVRIRQPRTLRKWLAAYAAAISTTTGYNEILDAATPGEGNKPAAKTTIAYREVLGRLWLIDELMAWTDGENYYSRLKKTPKHYLADTAFAIHLLGISMDSLLGKEGATVVNTRFDKAHGNIIGRLFEALVYQSLKVYTSVNNAEISYFHTQNGDREIDFILSRDSKTIAIEVKTAPFVDDADIRHLRWLKAEMGDALTDAAVITTGNLAYRTEDGIAVVPAALLGA